MLESFCLPLLLLTRYLIQTFPNAMDVDDDAQGEEIQYIDLGSSMSSTERTIITF
jgi:hypothetical protein